MVSRDIANDRLIIDKRSNDVIDNNRANKRRQCVSRETWTRYSNNETIIHTHVRSAFKLVRLSIGK